MNYSTSPNSQAGSGNPIPFPAAYMLVDFGNVPIVEAHVERHSEERRPEAISENDWRSALAWLRHRATWVVCRFEGDGFFYWMGAGQSPNPKIYPEPADSLYGHIDYAIECSVKLHSELSTLTRHMHTSQFANSRTVLEMEVRPPIVGRDYRTVISSADFHCEEPHRLAGWWKHATGLDHRYPRKGEAAALGFDDPGSGPLLSFIRSGEARKLTIRAASPTMSQTILALQDRGGVLTNRGRKSAQLTDPEGNTLRLLDAS